MRADSEIMACIEEIGPCLGSTLAATLCSKLGILPAAARKRIQRAKSNRTIIALEMRFKSNEQFFYLPHHQDTNQFSAAFIEALTQANSPLADCIAAIKSRGGLIPDQMFPVLAGVPFTGNPRVSSEIIKTILFKRRIIETIPSSIGPCLQLEEKLVPLSITETRLRARLRTEQIVISAVLDWLRLQGFVSAHTASIRFDDSLPQHGFFAWDLVAPSYISAFTTYENSRPSPGFIVADVSLGHTMNLAGVQYFINKCEKLRSQKHRPNIAMLIADWFDKDAFEAGRKRGLIFTTPRNLFGKDLSELLLELETLLDENASTTHKHDELLSKLIVQSKSLSHLQGVSANLRADIFELIVGHCIAKTAGTVAYGRKFVDVRGGECEVDVLALRPNHAVMAVECKSKLTGTLVSPGEVERWFAEVVPALYKEFMEDKWYRNAVYEFSIWTTSDFHPDALKRLEKYQQAQRYKVTWKTGQEVKAELAKSGDTRLLQQYKLSFQN